MPEGPQENSQNHDPVAEEKLAVDEPALWAEHPYFWEDVVHEGPGGEDDVGASADSDLSDSN